MNKLSSLLVAAVFIAACSSAEFLFQNPGEQQVELAEIENREYYLDSPHRRFELTNGVYEPNFGGRAAIEAVVFGPVGDLSNAAAVIIHYNGGGSGTFFYLYLLSKQGGEIQETFPIFLGDRTGVHEMWIENGKVMIAMRVNSGVDPLCCPTLEVIDTFQYRDGNLFLSFREELGSVYPFPNPTP